MCSEESEPAQSAPLVHMDWILEVLEAIPTAEAAHNVQSVHAVAANVSLTEEPYEGNPQVRFCEGR